MTQRMNRYMDACVRSLLLWSTEDLNTLASIITDELQKRINESRDADAEWMPGSE